MGLNISVGVLADLVEQDEAGAGWLRKTLQDVNDVLAENDLPTYAEPEQLPPIVSRARITGFSYSALHYLRRFYAHVSHDPSAVPRPAPDHQSPMDDPVLEAEMYRMSSHLLCHSDSEGFYLPVAFEPIVIDQTELKRIPGGIVGSSYQLMSELREMAPFLGIKLRGGELSDEDATRMNALAESDDDFCMEYMLWIVLFEAARLSIEHNSAIVFS
ncbi:hypothetical protein IQ266_03110 [filamentous cyanobacterium LEGE 11480]|uniref:Uncharacterized protein n=1 Tax=Romeriopsis navalis LEGE 11480 TaxID=2777977 RepID=A0A928VLU4_9CYAN|nr:hypothetical protein [Romeriopsis navalis]MBE9028747.1 hypothetical protein [Romeriopsis navalis LEGE 11480]